MHLAGFKTVRAMKRRDGLEGRWEVVIMKSKKEEFFTGEGGKR